MVVVCEVLMTPHLERVGPAALRGSGSSSSTWPAVSAVPLLDVAAGVASPRALAASSREIEASCALAKRPAAAADRERSGRSRGTSPASTARGEVVWLPIGARCRPPGTSEPTGHREHGRTSGFAVLQAPSRHAIRRGNGAEFNGTRTANVKGISVHKSITGGTRPRKPKARKFVRNDSASLAGVALAAALLSSSRTHDREVPRSIKAELCQVLTGDAAHLLRSTSDYTHPRPP